MSQRITGFDIARAFAVFGMVVVNFKLATGAHQTGPHWLLDAIGLLDGRAAATFVVLAGVGLSLLSAKAFRAGDITTLAEHRDQLLRRAAFLFVVGLLYTPIWPADILHFYGVYITLGALLLGASNRRLLVVAAALTVAFVILLLIFDYEKGWDWETLDYEGFWTAGGMVRHLFFNGFHPVFPWAAFLLFGMFLGRLDFRDGQLRRRILLAGLTVAVVVEGASRVLLSALMPAVDKAEHQDLVALLGTAPMPPMPQYILAGAATAAMVITLCVELGERFPDAAWLRPLISTGQLALTLYVAHVVVGMGTLEALGRLENGQSPEFAVLAALIFCSFSVVFAHLWRLRYRRGPLETLMRRSTGG